MQHTISLNNKLCLGNFCNYQRRLMILHITADAELSANFLHFAGSQQHTQNNYAIQITLKLYVTIKTSKKRKNQRLDKFGTTKYYITFTN